MKKLMSIILALTLIIPCISAFALNSSADSEYDKLWQEKMEYEKKMFGEGIRYRTGPEDFSPLTHGDIGLDGSGVGGFDFILFTAQGQKLTYNYYPHKGNILDASGWSFSAYWDEWETKTRCLVLCEELYGYFIDEIYEIDEKYDEYKYTSPYRLIVQKLGITKDELKEAYRKMKEEPEYLRRAIPELTDTEFEAYKEYLKNVEIPENFVIEAACMKDDEKAETLLNYPGFVYVKELGYSIEAKAMFEHIFSYKTIPIEDIVEFDLTTDGFILFFDDMKAYFEMEGNFFDRQGFKDDKGRTPRQVFDILFAEHERQMRENPKTGEPVYLIPVAVISLTLGVYAIYPRKKRKLEA